MKIICTITVEGQEGSSSFSGTVHDDWKGESGFINKVKLTKYLTSDELDNSIFYVCGPPQLPEETQRDAAVDIRLNVQEVHQDPSITAETDSISKNSSGVRRMEAGQATNIKS